MRSDFLGDCDVFYGLPEAMNRSRYLVPRLTRQQLREAIEGPAQLSGAHLSPRLLDQLLNELGARPDRLPVLQHALLRTWEEWKKDKEEWAKREAKKEEKEKKEPEPEIDLGHYKEAGTLENALSKHADEALKGNDEHTTATIFKCLTAVDANQRKVRRAANLSELAAVSRASEETVKTILRSFEEGGRHFVYMSEIPGTGDVRVDISHESLIRQWEKLRQWVDEEAEDSKAYVQLAEAAVRRQEGTEGLLQNPRLQLTLHWKERVSPTERWARRYHPAFESAMKYLSDSENDRAEKALLAREEKRKAAQARKSRRVIGLAAVVGIAIMASSLYWVFLERRVARARLLAAAAMTLDGSDLEKGVLLAVESIDRLPSRDNINAVQRLQRGIELLEKPEYQMKRSGPIEYLSFLPGGDLKVLSLEGPSEEDEEDEERMTAVVIKPDSWDLDEQPPTAFAVSNKGAHLTKWSPDGCCLARAVSTGRSLIRSGSYDIEITSEQSKMLPRPFSEVRALALSNQAGRVAIVEDARGDRFQIWDPKEQELVRMIQVPARYPGGKRNIRGIALSPDGRLVAAAADKEALVWDAETGSEIYAFIHPELVEFVFFGKAGRYLATVAQDFKVRLLSLQPKSVDPKIVVLEPAIELPHSGRISSVAFSADERYFVTDSEGAVQVWDTDGGELVSVLPHQGSIQAIAVRGGSGGISVATGSVDGSVKLWHVSKLDHDESVRSIAYHPSNDQLATAGADGTVVVWSADGARLHTLKHENWVTDLAFSPDGKYLATASDDLDAAVWKVGEWDERHQTLKHENWVHAVAFSPPDGRLIATGSSENATIIWDRDSGEEVRRLEHGAAVTDLAFHPGGRYLAAANLSGDAWIWNSENWELESMLSHGGRIRALSFSPEGNFLATGGEDGVTRIWDSKDWGGEGLPADLAPIRQFRHSGWVHSMAFSADENFLATGTRDGFVEVRETKEWSVVYRIPNNGEGRAVAFSPDLRHVAAASGRSVKRYLWQPEDLKEEACSIVGRALTESEWNQYLPGVDRDPVCGDPAAGATGGLKTAAADQEVEPVKPMLDLSSVTQELLETAADYNSGGARELAEMKYRIAVERAADSEASDAERFNANADICWQGVIRNFPDAVLPACDHAIEIREQDGSVRDSRAVALALLGKYDEAAKGFEFYVEWAGRNGRPPDRIEKRLQWISELRQGRNPIDEDTLKGLLSE